jgi:hypothetical protein
MSRTKIAGCLDYLIFLGLGYFFIVATIQCGTWRKSGFIVLFAAIASGHADENAI